ncbi:MAG TPA: tail fiber domain-containing protein [Sedimentisphaerales bacterium]|nr:tail fiber domain-containing protein [Sedimentisphaerales bacterium]
METRKILVILFLTLGLVLLRAEVSEAAPLGTAFTYQGHLYDNNDVANDLYDFQFKLYDANTAGNQLGTDVNKPDVDVISGYFTVELDFGSDVFNGNARWLEIGVRPGAENDPCEYMPLSPLQEVTAAPYSLQTRGILVDDALNVGIGAIDPSWRLTISEGGLNVFAGSSGETVGFSTEQFYVAGNNENYIMEIGDSPSDYTEFFDDGVSTLKIINNKVGIGTQTPDAKLDISGNVSVTGSVESTDAVIMATNTGSGDGIEGQSYGSSGRGVEGWALYTGPGANYGGYFRAESSGGYGVYGYASNSGNYENYGGYFQAAGNSGKGVYGFVTGDNGHAVQGMAFDSGPVTNYGGYFQARGASGRGVYGEATGSDGVGVYGEATGGGRAGHFEGDVHVTGNVGIGTTSPEASLEVTNSGSSHAIRASTSDIPVYAHRTGTSGTWPAVHGENDSASDNTSGVRGILNSTNSGANSAGVYGYNKGTFGDGYGVRGLHDGWGIGVYGECIGEGTGVYGKCSSSGNLGELGSSSYGVHGTNNSSGNFGFIGGPSDGVFGSTSSGNGVFGYSLTGHGVHGSSSSGYAGYFNGNLHVEGNITYTGSCSDVSDIRLKENITPLRNAVEKVSCLKGIYFNNKGESSDNREVGVIAQDVEKVLPELVSTNKQGYKSVDYTKLTPVLIEAVKELKAENESLKQRLEALEKTLQQLQAATTKGAI